MSHKKSIILFLILLVAVVTLPVTANAATITSRSVSMLNDTPSASTSYTFSFKPGTTGNIGAIKMQLCDSPVEAIACVNSGTSSGASFLTNVASLSGQTGISGFGVGGGSPPAPTANTFWISNGTPQSINSSTPVTVTLAGVHNPSGVNTEYYARITTYSNSAGTVEVDFGGVALATANPVTVSGVMPESLVFCVGTSGTDCLNITGNTVDLGTFSPLGTNVGTSVMSASTNSGFGYAITLAGPTLTSGANTISPMGTQSANSNGCIVSCTSAVGTSQYGVNVRANNIATAGGAFGSDPSGLGSGTAFGGYGSANVFRFFSGDTVASAAGPTNFNLYTSSYIVNVGGNQAAGVYTATMTYICTATF